MRADLTDLTVILDRSGSMKSCKKDAEGGLNEFVRKQKDQPGECLFTLVQFDENYELVHRAVPIRQVPENYVLSPRGSTALLDAIGRSITETGQRLAAMDESQRPGLVICVIITDGEENASREFKREQIRQMIEEQTNVYKWQFTYLGANQDAFTVASGLGIAKDATSNYREEKTSGGILVAASNVTRMRHAVSTGNAPVNAYTEDEKQAIN